MRHSQQHISLHTQSNIGWFKFLSLLVMLSFSTVLFSQNIFAHEQNDDQQLIHVVGAGEIQAEPDMAVLSIGINAQKPDLQQAKALADKNYRAVLEVLNKALVDNKHIRATRLSAQPIYEWQQNKRLYRGERVSRTLSITVHDLDALPELMQALVDSGVSTINSVTAGFRDKQAHQQSALGKAADDARAKAKFLAERLGRSLGEAVKINEQNVNVHQPRYQQAEMRVAAAKSSMADTAPPEEMYGLQVIRATVNVSFSLL